MSKDFPSTYGQEALREVPSGCMAAKVAGSHHRMVKKTIPEKNNITFSIRELSTGGCNTS